MDASTSEDGQDWQLLGQAQIELSEQAYIGLAMSSHDAAQQFGFASFDHVEVTTEAEKK